VLLFGQTARPSCSNRHRQLHQIVKSQKKHLFEPLTKKGYRINALMATNDCGKGWDRSLRDAYGSVLTDLVLDNCKTQKDHRCLMNRVLRLWDKHVAAVPQYLDGLVLLTRPDILWLKEGYKLILGLAHLASSHHIAWPFRCEKGAWESWQCVADTATCLPAAALLSYREACLGRVSCFPDARDDDKRVFFDSGGGFLVGSGYSGHGCYRCAKNEQQEAAALRNKSMTTADLQIINGFADIKLGLVWEAELRVNTRKEEGSNPFYEMPET
jgi:hypothetical protein